MVGSRGGTALALNLLTPVLLAGTSACAPNMAFEHGAAALERGAAWASEHGPSDQEKPLIQYKQKIEEAAIRGLPTVVRILGSGSPGSGVMISKKGNTYIVLTAGHVVKGSTASDGTSVITADGQEHRVKKIEISPWLDLAAVYFDSSKSYVTAPISDEANRKQVGNWVVVLGYPINSEKAIFVPAQILQLSLDPSDRPGGYTAGYFTRLPALPEWKWKQDTVKGMSGGPVLDLSGRLVAIHGEADQLPQLRVSDNTQASNSGKSLGIPAQIWKDANGDLSRLTEAWYKARPKRDDQTVDALFLKATKAVSEGRSAEALKLYDQAISKDPNDGSLYGNRAQVKGDMGDPKGALADFNKAIQLFPDSWQLYSLRGNLRSALGDHKGAQSDFDRSLSINRGYYKAEANKMRDLIRSGLAADASRVGERSMAGVSPASHHALVVGTELVRAYANQGKGEKALSLAQRLFEAQPDEAVLALQISQLYFNVLNEPVEGLKFLRKSLPRFTTNRGFLYNLSIAELNYGKPATAVRLLERLARSTEEDASVLRILCYALQKDRKPGEAIKSCESSLRLEPKSPQSHRYLGLALSDLGRHQDAIQQYTKSIEYSDQKSAIDYLNRAESQWKLGSRVAACADYRRAIRPGLAEKQTAQEIAEGWVPNFSVACRQ